VVIPEVVEVSVVVAQVEVINVRISQWFRKLLFGSADRDKPEFVEELQNEPWHETKREVLEPGIQMTEVLSPYPVVRPVTKLSTANYLQTTEPQIVEDEVRASRRRREEEEERKRKKERKRRQEEDESRSSSSGFDSSSSSDSGFGFGGSSDSGDSYSGGGGSFDGGGASGDY
jgi:uncharacterized membrane protein YgcG